MLDLLRLKSEVSNSLEEQYSSAAWGDSENKKLALANKENNNIIKKANGKLKDVEDILIENVEKIVATSKF